MQNLPYPDPLFISIESIKHYFQRKEEVLCVGTFLARFQSSKLNSACLNSSCTFALVSWALPCFIRTEAENSMEGHPLGDATVFCGGQSGSQWAPLKEVGEHELLQATDTRHAMLSHWTSSHQVLAPLFLAVDSVHIRAHVIWHCSSWVGSIYWDGSLGIEHQYLLSSLADWPAPTYATGSWELPVFCLSGCLLMEADFLCLRVLAWLWSIDTLCPQSSKGPSVTGALCALLC